MTVSLEQTRMNLRRAGPWGRWALLMALALAMVACRGRPESASSPSPQPAPTKPVIPTPTSVGEPATRPVEPAGSPAEMQIPTGQAKASPPVEPAEAGAETDLPLDLDWTVADEDIQATYRRLSQAIPPERDDLELARVYLGWDGNYERPSQVEPLSVGTAATLKVLNQDRNTIEAVEAEILVVSERAYFWFENGPGVDRPSNGQLTRMAELFDFIYEETVAIFGPEDRPGVDGDLRLHLLHASPATICETGPEQNYQCRVAGIFSADDTLPTEAYPSSNAREMFVVNARYFGSDFYLSVLAHELRHMIEDNYDRGDDDWVVEGSAMLSEELVGFPGNGVARANLFLQDPDQQLNRWTNGYTTPYYGQGYLFNRFLYDRLGQDLYRQFAASPATGLKAVDEVARSNGLKLTGEELWQDFLVALAVHDQRHAPEQYRFDVKGLDRAAMTEVTNYPATYDELVRQYAADYYLLSGDETLDLLFQGSELAPVLDTAPTSGRAMWLSNRANYSHMRLTRPLDLRDVEQATLHYSVYHDIELGYDFGYLFVSEDGGRTWQALEAEQMQGLGPGDDPSGSALAPRFYSGRSNVWRRESVDLSPHAGQEILIRFAYVTDPILTFGGLALDDIAVPEIGFSDGAETEESGWLAEGFDRVTAAMPQPWRLQLITFPDSAPRAERLSLDQQAHFTGTLDLRTSGGRAILIVAASAPMTLEPAAYSLTVEVARP